MLSPAGEVSESFAFERILGLHHKLNWTCASRVRLTSATELESKPDWKLITPRRRGTSYTFVLIRRDTIRYDPPSADREQSS